MDEDYKELARLIRRFENGDSFSVSVKFTVHGGLAARLLILEKLTGMESSKLLSVIVQNGLAETERKIHNEFSTLIGAAILSGEMAPEKLCRLRKRAQQILDEVEQEEANGR